MANSVDPGQMPQNAASDLGLHCLLRPVCSGLRVITVALNILSKIVADDILNLFLLLCADYSHGADGLHVMGFIFSEKKKISK